MSDDNFLTIKEAADMLKISESTIRRWCDEGHLPYLQIRTYSSIRIRLQDILAKLKNHC